MDGLEFARRFRRSLSRRDVPIVLISVVGDEPVRQAALDAGVIDFVAKPVRPRELRARCQNLLQLRQQGESVKERARSLEERVLEGLHEVEQRERETLFLLGQGDRIPRSGHRHPSVADVALRRGHRRGAGHVRRRRPHPDLGRAAARHRQDRHSRCDPAQARRPDRRGIRGHAPAPADRLRHPARQPEPFRADGRVDRAATP